MYKLLLTFRYLRRKLIPIFAMLAVVLCTAMVIIVISIMGGFLDMVKNAGRTLMGDVSIYTGLSGFGHYEQMITEIEAMPEAEAATPIVVAYGLLKLPGDVIKGVQVYGVDGESQDRVTRYRKTLHWTTERLQTTSAVQEVYGDYDPVELAVEMASPWTDDSPAMVTGLEISPYNIRLEDGTYAYSPPMPGFRVVLSILPVTQRGGMLEPATEQFRVVNEFNSGVYDIDSQRVFIPFRVAQKMMSMDAAQKVDTSVTPPKVIGEVPARASELHIRAAEGVTPDQLREAVIAVYDRFARTHSDVPPRNPRTVETWQQRQAQFLQAVENEKGLMTFLFGIISVVAVAMIGVIFYMIVLEKTRDIGILRAIGASRFGVASIFLSFGAVLGVIGSATGTLVAWLIVTNINEIHTWLGETFGIVIWDKSVYFFDRIPSQVDWSEITVIVLVAIVASILGAVAPAIKAARVDPVESLRYE